MSAWALVWLTSSPVFMGFLLGWQGGTVLNTWCVRECLCMLLSP